METDYTHEGKQLLLRALAAMVEHTELHAKSCDNPWYDGEDFAKVYNALVSCPTEVVMAAKEGISEGFAKVLLEAME